MFKLFHIRRNLLHTSPMDITWTIPGDIQVDFGAPVDLMAGVSAVNQQGEDLTEYIKIRGNVTSQVVGTQNIEYYIEINGQYYEGTLRKLTVRMPKTILYKNGNFVIGVNPANETRYAEQYGGIDVQYAKGQSNYDNYINGTASTPPWYNSTISYYPPQKATKAWFDTPMSLKSTSYLFAGFTKLVDVDLTNLAFDQVENASGMFYGCSVLEFLTFGTNAQPTKLNRATSMFSGCQWLNFDFIENWVNIHNLQAIDGMFNSCQWLEEIDLSGWDVSQVTNMSGLFQGCTRLQKVNFTGWDTSNVTAMTSMFYGCNNRGFTTLDLSAFDTSKVTNMNQMFYRCTFLEQVIVSNKFVVSQVNYSSNMFYDCTNIKGGAGTVFSTNYVDKGRAYIDGSYSTSGTLIRGYFWGNADPLPPKLEHPEMVYYDIGDSFNFMSSVTATDGDSGEDITNRITYTSSNASFNTSAANSTVVTYRVVGDNGKVTTNTCAFYARRRNTVLFGDGTLVFFHKQSTLLAQAKLHRRISAEYSFYPDSNAITSSDYYGWQDNSNITKVRFDTAWSPTNLDYLLYGVARGSKEGLTIDWTNCNFGNVTSAKYTFVHVRFKTLSLAPFSNASRCTNYSHFLNYASFKDGVLNLASLNTSAATNVTGMFNSTGWETYRAEEDRWYASYDLTENIANYPWYTGLTINNLSSLNLNRVTDGSTFMYNSQISNASASQFSSINFPAATELRQAFAKLFFPTVINLNSLNPTASRFSASSLLNGCQNVVTVYLKNFTATGKLYSTGHQNFFTDCKKLVTIYSRNWQFDSPNSVSNAFDNNYVLVGGAGSKAQGGKYGYGYCKIDGGSSNKGFFTTAP